MNLIEQYKSPILYEQIKIGDTLIVTECYNPDEYYCNQEPDVGETVTVVNKITCDKEYARAFCEVSPCPCRCECITVQNSEELTCTSCFYKFTTIDGRTII